MAQADLKLINSFLIFADSKNIIEAAIRLKISQPALSSHLKQFEDGLPQKIFVMQGRKKVLNKFGLDLFEELKNKLGGVENVIDQVILRHGDKQQSTIKIGGRKEVLTQLIKNLKFDGRIEFHDCDLKLALDWLQKSKLDLALIQERPDSAYLTSKPLFRNQFQLIVPKKMKIQSKQLSKKLVAELIDLPYISYKSEMEQNKRLFEKYDLILVEKAFRVFSDWPTLISLAEEGVGWVVAPTSFNFDQQKCDSFIIPTDILPANDFFMIFPKANSKIPWFSELAEEIKSVFNN